MSPLKILSLIVGTVFLLAGCSSKTVSKEGLGPAPSFTLPSLDGQEKSLEDFKGRPILLHFWATWCPPCREEMPLFQKFYNELGPSGLVVLGINVGEPPEVVRNFVEELKVTFPILLDEKGKIANKYGVRGLPTTFWIDPSGEIVDVTLGGPLPEEFILENLHKIGAGKKWR